MSLKKKEKEAKETTKGGGSTGKLIIVGCAIVAAVLSFVLLMNIEKSMLTDYEKTSVVVIKQELPKNLILTEANVDQYVSTEEREQAVLPEGVFTSKADLLGSYATYKIGVGTLATTNMFTKFSGLQEDIGDAVTLSFSVGSSFQSVNGSIKSGDYINIYRPFVNQLTGEVYTSSKIEWQKIYVLEARTAAGEMVAPESPNGQATAFTILINKSDVAAFLTDLDSASIQLVNVSDLVEEGTFEFEEPVIPSGTGDGVNGLIGSDGSISGASWGVETPDQTLAESQDALTETPTE